MGHHVWNRDPDVTWPLLFAPPCWQCRKWLVLAPQNSSLLTLLLILIQQKLICTLQNWIAQQHNAPGVLFTTFENDFLDLQYPDIYNYLINLPSSYTGDSLKAYKSLGLQMDKVRICINPSAMETTCQRKLHPHRKSKYNFIPVVAWAV